MEHRSTPSPHDHRGGRSTPRGSEDSRLERITLLHHISSIAISSLDAERITEQVTDAVYAQFSPLFVAVRLANRERNRLRLVALPGLPDDYVAEAGILSADADHVVSEVFRTGRPTWGGRVDTHPKGAQLARDLARCGVEPGSHLVLPLRGRTSTVGVLTIGWATRTMHNDHDVEFFSSLANILAVGVENAYLYEDERGAAEIARRLSAASQKLASEFSGIFESLTDAVIVVDPTTGVTRANTAAVTLFGFDPVGLTPEDLKDSAGILCPQDAIPRPHKTPCDAALAGLIVRDIPVSLTRNDTTIQLLVSASPIVTDGVVAAAVTVWHDISEHERLIENLARERQRVESILASITDGFAVVDRSGVYRSVNASLAQMFGRTSDQILGRHLADVFPESNDSDVRSALEAAIAEETSSAFVQYYAPTGLWAETRVYPASDGATMFVTDVSKRRHDELERERLLSAYEMELARTSLLKDIAATAGSSLSIEQVCTRVLDTVRSHLDPCQATLHLYDDSSDTLVLATQIGLPAHIASASASVPADESSVPGRTLVHGAHIVTHDSSGALWLDQGRARDMRWIMVPIASAENALGVLGLAFETRRPFTEDEVSLFRGIAGQLAIALDNARLYQRQHRIADTLQRSLLAESLRVPGLEIGRAYRSATEHVRVGGDFYDVYPLPDGSAGITIGDVSGKGLKAAAITALVRNTLRAYALDGCAPHEALSRANEVLCYFSDREVFATATYATLDPAGGLLRYCNGGHPASLILAADGSVRTLDVFGPMLGAMEGLAYATGEERLGDGDTLICYTDGVTEARAGQDFFGDERLVQLVATFAQAPPGVIASGIADAATEYGGGVLRDDLAVIAIRLSSTGVT